MDLKTLDTAAPKTWCPGCGNFAILNAVKAAIGAALDEGFPREKIVMVAGIGCHAKIADYLNIHSFYSLHGRSLPAATAIKIARPDCKVIVCAGDGDAYGEGLEHLLFAAKRNIGITMFVHNNRVYGLTTGQSSPTSPEGFKGRSTPFGMKEHPFNPLELALAAGATFVARGYSNAMDGLKGVMKDALAHPGFALVDILQVCATFFNRYDVYNERVTPLADHDPSSLEAAVTRARQWDYNADAPIALGVFYRRKMGAFEDSFPRLPAQERRSDRAAAVREYLKEYL